IRDAALDTDLLERSVPLIVELEARHRIVRDENVRPPVAIVVPDRHAERLAGRRADPRGRGDVFEAPLAFIAVEDTMRHLVGRRNAVAPPPRLCRVAGLIIGEGGIPDIIADEQIEAAIPVVVEPDAGSAPSAWVAHAGFLRDILQAGGPVRRTLVVEQ